MSNGSLWGLLRKEKSPRLKRTHLIQLMSYLNVREQEGWYYGNKEQFNKRHNEIKIWLQKAIDSDG